MIDYLFNHARLTRRDAVTTAAVVPRMSVLVPRAAAALLELLEGRHGLGLGLGVGVGLGLGLGVGAAADNGDDDSNPAYNEGAKDSGLCQGDGLPGMSCGPTGSSNSSAFNVTTVSGHGLAQTLATIAVLGVIILAAVIGNVFVIAAVVLERNLHNVANYLVASLAGADLMVSTLVMPLAAVNEVSQGWFLGKSICDMWVSFDVVCCTASILHLVAISMDRYWAVTRIDYIHNRSARRILIMIALSWGLALAISIPPLFINQSDSDLDPNATGECMISQNLGYTVYSTVGAFYLPFIVMMIIYFRVFLAARERIRKKRFRESRRQMKRANHMPLTSTTSGCAVDAPSNCSNASATDCYAEISTPVIGVLGRGSVKRLRGEQESSTCGSTLLPTVNFAADDGGTEDGCGGREIEGGRKGVGVGLLQPDSPASMEARKNGVASRSGNARSAASSHGESPSSTSSLSPRGAGSAATPTFLFVQPPAPPPGLSAPTRHSLDLTSASQPLTAAGGCPPTQSKASRAPSCGQFLSATAASPSGGSGLGSDNLSLRSSWFDLTKQYLGSKPTAAAAAVGRAVRRELSPKTKQKKVKEKLEARRERKAARTLAIITGSFCLCWLPFFIVAIVRPFCGERCHFPILLLSVINWLGYFNSLLNPIIYTLFNPDFRSAFRKILFGKYRKQKYYRPPGVGSASVALGSPCHH